ncbi:MAG: 16S rRNA (guanine(966)-N(2))-methyltransferase RsmD [Dehalococcoidales bacterium]|jgi:16S rRNA (guanine966-N2)-methyltransferase
MRVIAGSAKGHPIKVARGTPTRPATDLVRGAIFSMLTSITDNWSQVLDLFSGSGSLGIEALSRDAGFVDFVEREPKSCAMIRENLTNTGLVDRAHVYCCSVTRAISFLDKTYNIVLMDPPYSNKSIGKVITQLAGSSLIDCHSIVVITHSPHLTLANEYASLELLKEKRHGDSCIAIYQKGGNP